MTTTLKPSPARAALQRLRKDNNLAGWLDEALTDAIGAHWYDKNEAAWWSAYDELKSYIEENGNANPPKDHVTSTGFRLGEWVTRARTSKKASTGMALTAERTTALEKLPGWEWDQQDAKYRNGFAHLAQYVETHGTADVPQKHKTPDGFLLGRWVARARAGHVGTNNYVMNTERRAELEALPGWVWVGDKSRRLSEPHTSES